MNKIKIGDFLTRVKEVVELVDENDYKRVTIRSKGGGVFLRDVVPGSEIGTKRQFIVSTGQFLLSKIDARNGAFGIVPEELQGAIITGNFWTYDVDETIVDVEWLHHFVTTDDFIDICAKSSSGTTNRRYLNEEKFLDFELDLPDLKEQQHLVGRMIELERMKEEVLKQLKLLDMLKKQTVIESFHTKSTP